MREIILTAVIILLTTACEPMAHGPAPQTTSLTVEPRTISELAGSMKDGALTAEQVAQSFLDRIAAVDDSGPTLNAVIITNPTALSDARALDAAKGESLLRGIPILLKDNIETRDPMATTAGSLALKDNLAGRDSPLVARLRAEGAIILGKTNLSEWANFRSGSSTSGWSAVGGLTKNPHVLDRNPCGSSSGSGAAVAAGLAPAAIGTETDGSIVCPSAANGIVGLKPTVGLIPRTHIVPISATQDTAGPMALTVSDVALLLTVMAGSDPSDPATSEADSRKSDYRQALDANALQGKRIGVARWLTGYHAGTDAAFEKALTDLKAAGAELVDINAFPNRQAMGAAEFTILLAEFKAGLNAYLATTPAAVKVRTLDGLIAFNAATPAEMAYFGQDTFAEAAKAPALTDKAYLDARAVASRMSRTDGVDKILAENSIIAIVAPTGGPAWTTDLVTGDHFLGSASGLAAVAGYPHITVPMGVVHDLPVGLSFFGPAWSEATLIGLAYAYEQRTHARKTPAFLPQSP